MRDRMLSKEAKEELCKKYKFTKIQIGMILDIYKDVI